MDIVMVHARKVSPFESKDLDPIIEAVVPVLVWGAYLGNSRRAKETFVR